MLCSVSVPTMLHRQVALDCIAAGVNTLVEKPIAATVAEGEEMISAAQGTPGVKSSLRPHRTLPTRLLSSAKRSGRRSGELGRIFQVHARRLGPFPASYPRCGGGD